MESSHRKLFQKGILVTALKAYFVHGIESSMLLKVVEKTFAEWNSDADEA